jgi:predicted outer membrane repeat protein
MLIATPAPAGALYINQVDCLLPVKPPCSLRIANHTFHSNTATAAGGAIYFAAPFQSNVTVANLNSSPDSVSSYLDTRFESPRVSSACASVVKAHMAAFRPSPAQPLNKELNIFTNNTVLGSPQSAGYGPDVATAVACMLRANTTSSPQTSSSSATTLEVAQPHVIVASGDTFSLLLRAYDAYGQLVSQPLAHVTYTATAGSNGNSSSVADPSVSITNPSPAVFNPPLRCLEIQNLYIFSTSYAFYNVTISAVVSSLQPVAQTSVTVQLRPCCVGQVATGRSCKSCSSATARNQYSFNPQNQTCDRCPDHAVCGGSTLMATNGYWHASPRSNRLHVCPVYDACASPDRVATLEGFQQQLLGTCGQPGLDPADVRRYSQVQCRQGYGGNVCGNCQYGGKKVYGRKGKVCSTCASRCVLVYVLLQSCSCFLCVVVVACTEAICRMA